VPPAPSGNVVPLAVLTARSTADGFTVNVSGSALAEIWGSARTQVERAGIVRDVLVTRTGAETFAAVSGVCTHEGCIVSRVDRPVFVCPCHGSRYDHTGAVLQGPAPAALPRYDTAFAQGLLTVYL
jgi:Rieske Fe-S protein